MIDSFSLIMKNEQDIVIGFAMGYFKQYDDIVGYSLEEIIISADYQHKGFGSILLKEIETKVKEKGAYCVELQAVNDELHEKYYNKAGYKKARLAYMKGNSQSRRFWEKCGFTETGIEKENNHGIAVVLEKIL